MYKTKNEISDPEEGGRAIALPLFCLVHFFMAPDVYDLDNFTNFATESNKTAEQ